MSEAFPTSNLFIVFFLPPPLSLTASFHTSNSPHLHLTSIYLSLPNSFRCYQNPPNPFSYSGARTHFMMPVLSSVRTVSLSHSICFCPCSLIDQYCTYTYHSALLPLQMLLLYTFPQLHLTVATSSIKSLK